jgi:hypothetical protein
MENYAPDSACERQTRIETSAPIRRVNIGVYYAREWTELNRSVGDKNWVDENCYTDDDNKETIKIVSVQ